MRFPHNLCCHFCLSFSLQGIQSSFYVIHLDQLVETSPNGQKSLLLEAQQRDLAIWPLTELEVRPPSHDMLPGCPEYETQVSVAYMRVSYL